MSVKEAVGEGERTGRRKVVVPIEGLEWSDREEGAGGAGGCWEGAAWSSHLWHSLHSGFLCSPDGCPCPWTCAHHHHLPASASPMPSTTITCTCPGHRYHCPCPYLAMAYGNTHLAIWALRPSLRESRPCGPKFDSDSVRTSRAHNPHPNLTWPRVGCPAARSGSHTECMQGFFFVCFFLCLFSLCFRRRSLRPCLERLSLILSFFFM